MTDNTITNNESEFDWFKNNGIYMPMINDTHRNIFYKRAIESSAAGKTVCDIGTGTGLLSILAAKAGASKVISVEMDPGRAAFAKSMIDKVGLGDKIEIINDNFYNTDIKADLYISETIGTSIFNEHIINISKHALRNGGVFLPGQFEIFARVYENHPIFPIVQQRSDAFEFQPDIEIDQTFETAINTAFQSQHGLDSTLYRANAIDDLFNQLHKFTDLKLNLLYESEPLIVDLNSTVNTEDIKITIPSQEVFFENDGGCCVVIFWRCRHGDIVLKSEDSMWGHMSKIILNRTRNPGKDITTWFDPTLNDWRFSF